MIVFGSGVINNLLNALPVELHIPGYQYCGPGTKLQERLARGDPGINPLDQACKIHDIAYLKNRENVQLRNEADEKLVQRAQERVLAGDASIGEKAAAALAIANVMKIKSKLGMGCQKQKKKSAKRRGRGGKLTFRSIVTAAKNSLPKSNNSKVLIAAALKGAKKAVKKSGGKTHIKKLRVLPIPSKTGGLLPLVPIFAGLSALGALAGGAAGIAKAVTDTNMAKKQLEEAKRHNQVMEEVNMGKGLYLRPYKTGGGLRLHTESKKKTS